MKDKEFSKRYYMAQAILYNAYLHRKLNNIEPDRMLAMTLSWDLKEYINKYN